MTTWNLSFFKTLAERSISAGAGAFVSVWGANGAITLHALYIALGTAGSLALYTFVQGIAVSQVTQKAAGKPSFPS